MQGSTSAPLGPYEMFLEECWQLKPDNHEDVTRQLFKVTKNCFGKGGEYHILFPFSRVYTVVEIDLPEPFLLTGAIGRYMNQPDGIVSFVLWPDRDTDGLNELSGRPFTVSGWRPVLELSGGKGGVDVSLYNDPGRNPKDPLASVAVSGASGFAGLLMMLTQTLALRVPDAVANAA